jgi:hypothetical protein
MRSKADECASVWANCACDCVRAAAAVNGRRQGFVCSVCCVCVCVRECVSCVLVRACVRAVLCGCARTCVCCVYAVCVSARGGAGGFGRACRAFTLRRYGTVCVNTWSAAALYKAAGTWGAYPGESLDNVQSGTAAVPCHHGRGPPLPASCSQLACKA